MFEVLSDRGNQVAQTYKVALTLPESLRWVYSETFKLDLPAFNGDDSWTLPMPSRFIVDQQVVIRGADVNLDHTVRPEPDTAIETLRILKAERDIKIDFIPLKMTQDILEINQIEIGLTFQNR
jgi:peroxiredoxin